jgi:pantoate--beta-alanine ligase
MQVITDISSCRAAVRYLQKSEGTVALVPTMGALHEGHVALMSEGLRRCRHLAVTIFVNPTQFGPGEDYRTYPRTPEFDLEKCRAAGAEIVFMPGVETMFPQDSGTRIHVAGLGEGLCGPFRPGHFDGVATVVAKLFHILPADVAVFGEKDYQQLAIIRRMVVDLNLPIEIAGHPTVRESDGMAMSSRNAYLTAAERRQAASLSAGLFAAVELAKQGEWRSEALVKSVRQRIESAGPSSIEYVEVVDAESLRALAVVDRPARICLAVRIGRSRLIDNVAVDPQVSGG